MLDSQNITAFVLCGGKSSRMQTEKGLVHYQGKPFIHWIIEAVLPITSTIILVTNNEAYRFIGLPMINDIHAGKGPVGGIHAALRHSRTKRNLILSCDVPKITTDLLSQLIVEAKTNHPQVTFLSDAKHDYPLIGMYRKEAVGIFEEAIAADKLKLCSLVNLISHQKIFIHQDQKSLVQNINSKAELLALSKPD